MKFNRTWPPPEPQNGWALPPGVSFTTPIGMIEDAQMRRMSNATHLARFNADLGIEAHEQVPGREEKIDTGPEE